MHYQFKLSADFVDSFDRVYLETYEIDNYLNRAILLFFKDMYKFDDRIKKGFETDQARIDKLKTLHVKSPELQPAIIPINLGNGLYEVRLKDLGNGLNGQFFRYFHMTKAKVKAVKNNCFKKMTVDIVQIDDDQTKYSDASWLWRRVLGNFGRSTFVHPHLDINNTDDTVYTTADLLPANQFNNDQLSSLYLNTNNILGDQQFEVINIEISYLKYPNRVFFGGYTHTDGLSNNQSPPIHCDLDEGFHDEIIRKAVQIAKEDLQDQLGIQITNTQTLQDKV